MLSIEYFQIIQMIEELFNKKNYIKEKNIKNNYIEIKVIKTDNIEYNYVIKIYLNNNNIEVTIPITNSNYKFKTILYDINSVYNYLYFHANIFT